MRIAVSGSHRVGKSTLVAALGEVLSDHLIVDEPYHEMGEAGHLFAQPPSVDDFEDQLNHSIARLQEGWKSVIFDRCPVDLLAYLLEEAPGEEETWRRVGDAVRTLDLVVFVPIERPDRTSRLSQDEDESRWRVDQRLRDILLSDSLRFGIEATVVRGSVEERVATVLARLER